LSQELVPLACGDLQLHAQVVHLVPQVVSLITDEAQVTTKPFNLLVEGEGLRVSLPQRPACQGVWGSLLCTLIEGRRHGAIVLRSLVDLFGLPLRPTPERRVKGDGEAGMERERV
jgi:hypothetical protein